MFAVSEKALTYVSKSYLQPLSPPFNGPRCSARPFVDRLSPVPFSGLHVSDSSGMLTGDKGIVHGGLPENLELHRLEHPLEITRPTVSAIHYQLSQRSDYTDCGSLRCQIFPLSQNLLFSLFPQVHTHNMFPSKL